MLQEQWILARREKDEEEMVKILRKIKEEFELFPEEILEAFYLYLVQKEPYFDKEHLNNLYDTLENIFSFVE